MTFICKAVPLLWHQPEDIVKSLLSACILLRVQEIITGALDAILVADGAGESRRAKLALALGCAKTVNYVPSSLVIVILRLADKNDP